MEPSPSERRSRSRSWRRGGVGGVVLRGAVEHRRKLIHGKGLGQIIRSAAAHGFDGRVHRARGGHGDDRGVGVEQLDLGDQFQALIRPRGQIHQQDVGGVAAQETPRLGQIARAFDSVAQAGRDFRAGRAHRRVGIHHQQVQANHRLGELWDKLHGPCVEDCIQHCIRLMRGWNIVKFEGQASRFQAVS